MANLTCYIQSDMSADSTFGYDSELVSYSSHHITVSYGSDITQTYYGTFNFYSNPISGTITSAVWSHNGQMTTTLYNISLDIWTLYDFENRNDATGLEQYLLRGNDVINGSDYSDVLYGFSGNDMMAGKSGNDTLNGFDGIDTAVFSDSHANYTIALTASNRTVADHVGSDGADSLISIERLEFTDVSLAFDIDGNAGQAYRLYQAAFNRVPDEGGLGFWIGEMDKGVTLAQVASGFINSDEFRGLYGTNPSNAEFVDLLYQNVLHREPDTGGYNYWMNELTHGLSREQILISFSESTENKAALMAFDMDSNMGQAYRLYQAAFDRIPDIPGLDFWYREMNNGVSLNQVASGFINSAEFQGLYGNNPTNGEFIELLYNNVLDREPDQGGYDFWVNELEHDLSREQALIGFSESIENKLALVGIVQDGIEFFM